MKTTQIIITLLLISIGGFWACQNGQANVSQPSDIEAPNLPNGPLKSVDPACNMAYSPDSISQWPDSVSLTFQIQDSCATQFIQDYKAYINGVKESLPSSVQHENKLIYGTMVSLWTLRQVLSYAEQRNNDSLYIMLGIMPDNSTGMIFSLKKEAENTWGYFDFTVPCPNACPDWINDDES